MSESAASRRARRSRRRYAKFLDDNRDALLGYFDRDADGDTAERSEGERADRAEWRLRVARFCPQSLVWRPTSRMRCNLAAVCPFCWSRAAGDAWDRVADFLFPPDPAGVRPEEARFDLVTIRRTVVHAGSVPDLATFLDARLAPRAAGAAKGRDVGVVPRWREGGGSAASLDVTTVAPTAVATDGAVEARFATTVRQLFAVEPGAAFAAPEGARVARAATPSRARAAAAVAATFRFPWGALVPAPGLDVAAHGAGVVYFMGLRRGRRLWVARGGFRGGGRDG